MATKKIKVPKMAWDMMAFEMPVTATFIEGLLGTLPNNTNLLGTYVSKIEDKKKKEEEIAAIGGSAEYCDRQKTVFPRTPGDNQPFIYDYQLKGYYKEKWKFMRQIEGTVSEDMTAGKSKIDGLFFIKDRMNVLYIPEGVDIAECERTLRANIQGQDINSIAVSEELSKGTTCNFTCITFSLADMEAVKEWLKYGIFHGTGCWRNSGKGRFVCDFYPVIQRPIDYDEYRARCMHMLEEEQRLTAWNVARERQQAESKNLAKIYDLAPDINAVIELAKKKAAEQAEAEAKAAAEKAAKEAAKAAKAAAKAAEKAAKEAEDDDAE